MSAPLLDPDRLGRRDELGVLLREWASVRNQGDVALAGQLSALSLGIAAVSVLIASVASTWSRAPLVACAGLMAVVPPVALFVVLIWATEIKKTLRASSFLRRVVEPRVNAMFPRGQDPLTWETEGYAYGRIVPYYVSIALFLIGLAVVSYTVGVVKFERVRVGHRGWLWSGWWPIVFGFGVAILLAVGLSFIAHEARTNIAERGAPST